MEVISIKVIGYLWCIIGSLGVVFGAITLVYVVQGYFLYDSGTYSYLITYQTTGIAEGVIQFVAGMIGIFNYNKPKRAVLCYFSGGTVFLINLVTLVILIIAHKSNIVVSLFSIVLAVIYMRGAFKHLGEFEF